MDFFERQDKARRNTALLVAYFGAGVTLLIGVLYLAVLLIFSGFSSERHHSPGYHQKSRTALWNPQLFLGVAVGTLAVVAMGSLFKMSELAQGGKAVANMLGGKLINPATTHPDERKVLNVVEEMALASGVPVPQVYLLPKEQGINAFAAGHTPGDAVIGVTRGAVSLLSRDELQGVIGHEFSHILNGDMRLNLRLMGVIFGLLCLAVIGRVLLSVRSRGTKDKNPLPVLGLALLVVGWVGVLFGRLIQAAVSRQREFLADAAAVQFTRNPAGLAGALKKIGGLASGSKLHSPQAAEASHMFFGSGVRASFLGLMNTHPPLAARIRALDPSFDGVFEPVRSVAAASAASPPVPPRKSARPFAATAAFGPPAPPVIPARSVLPSLGNPTTPHLRYAEELRAAIPDHLRQAARESLGASALVYALLLSNDEPVRRAQLEKLAHTAGAPVCQEALRIWPDARQLAARSRLPLVDLALPGLRQMSPSQFQQFQHAVRQLVECDSEIDLFEYVLQRIVLRHLAPHYLPVRKIVVQFYALKPLLPDCAILLSALAHTGHDSPENVAAAFERGVAALSRAAQTDVVLVSPADCDLGRVDRALDRLAQAAPQIKKNALEACAQTVAADGLIQELEAELLRAIADTLDCPIPPFASPRAEPIPMEPAMSRDQPRPTPSVSRQGNTGSENPEETPGPR
jgi:Zn-dependent protease with chaperone function